MSVPTSGATLDRPHVWRPGTQGPPLLLLHGTGGDEHDLIGLADRLAPDAPVLSPRGTVTERGMPRFFHRLAEGVFDEDDLRVRTDELAAFLRTAEEAYDVAAGAWVAVGFSNGANIAASLLLQHPVALSGAVLLAAMVPYRQAPAGGPDDLAGRWAIIANGRRDPLASPTQTEVLAGQLRDRGAGVAVLAHGGGHTVDPDQLNVLARHITSHGVELR